MITVESARDLTQALAGMQGTEARNVGLVPTMGNLHDGHLTLVEQARSTSDICIVSSFVNPLQFGANEDLGAYPHTPEEDAQHCAQAGVDILFRPTIDDVYPKGMDLQTRISVPHLADIHCGASRPGHFDGVATVVLKLFNLSHCTRAFFGEKDFQQLAIIRHMVADLNVPVEVIGVPIVREQDGLAMSSRNNYLTPKERTIAPMLYQQLCGLREAINAGERDFQSMQTDAAAALNNGGMQTDFITICDRDSLQPGSALSKDLVILAAAYLGRARLIDNIQISLKS